MTEHCDCKEKNLPEILRVFNLLKQLYVLVGMNLRYHGGDITLLAVGCLSMQPRVT